MKKIIITILIFIAQISIVCATISVDWEEYDEQLKKMLNSKEFKEGLPKLTPIFNLNCNVYTFQEDGYDFYKINKDDVKVQIAITKNYFSDGNAWNYSAYKIKNDIYILHSFIDEATSYQIMIAIDERTGKTFKYRLYGGIEHTIYIDDGYLYVDGLNITPYGIGRNKSKNAEIKIYESEVDSGFRDGTKVHIRGSEFISFNKDKIILSKDFIEYYYKDKKTGKTYSKKEVLMYEHYYYLKFLMKTFGEIDDEPFGSFGLDLDIVSYTPEDIKKIYTGADPSDKTILSIEEFCKGIRKDLPDNKSNEKKGFIDRVVYKVKNIFK
ncbi:hypothetical protein [Endomicrobium proavitum]|uniref:Uncharacterized protein n=1 Tax=Endomicrobium proavitum TaxID=1408281 RepID=A0A0G3WK20_9BACT|nr:hypothetical protein [Endomicrobium proavitum]AKL98227.1 exported protein of unknown function [Endomicrobium proavitum]